ncbi:mycobacterial cell wall arabinan synthesis family protein [Mycobacterium xenopi 4042]|uniref:Mycobacterial cell wall arabinan synthesis family protein n=1 Tax=Mycobacterium xenopi 4042 TaxID=1299334 RepID=X7ZKN4_MYCXE|nr:mycobacterial cell wall arabinan synthesis family protein [Mycobacterium xenopi 4042]
MCRCRRSCARRGTGYRRGTRPARSWWCRPPGASTPTRSRCSGQVKTESPRAQLISSTWGGAGVAKPARADGCAARSATRVRVVATDDDLAPQHWIAVTPPRMPRLRTLQDVVGSRDPVLLDWLVGLAFPCQRPFDHRNGVIEAPKWRILPDRFGAEANSPVMDNNGGARWGSPNC